MKEDLSRKEITRCIGIGFEVYMEYRVDWVAKYGKMDENHTFWAFFGEPVPVHLGPVPVQPSITELVPVQVRYTLLCFDQF